MVYLVDDEDVVRDALAWLLRSRRLLSEGFASAEAFETMLEFQLPAGGSSGGSSGGAAAGPSQPSPTASLGAVPVPTAHHDSECVDWPRAPSCLLLDVRMPGTSGLVLFERLVERGLLDALPVIFLTGHGDVPTAVSAVKRGAFDFVEKPFSDNALVDRVEQALEGSATAIARRRDRQALTRRIAELTEREREVMRLVTQGHTNKLIADQLAISVRTVEVHRAHLFEKMQVTSAVELANLLRRVPGTPG
jgi:two-component system response regulator DctR